MHTYRERQNLLRPLNVAHKFIWFKVSLPFKK